jgi:methionine salvage enolase-phosphatase E1
MKIFLNAHKDFEKNFKIKFDKPKIREHGNGFISVQLDWHSKKDTVDFWKFKYPELAHVTYGGIAVHKKKKYRNHSASFDFPELNDHDFKSLKMASWFDICVGYETEEESYIQGYEYTFFEKPKYGLLCWFAPKGWEDWDNAKTIE